ncbi:hypothetical protein HDU67_002878 [Dinochytrium kinnereticum]|nr:hypothetical protein HDU67_002878 [Dinochytrium kinnereticum]
MGAAHIRSMVMSRFFWSSGRGLSTTTTGKGDDANPPSPGKRDLRTLFREYGPIALLVYASLSFTVFLICFSSITFLGVNQQTIQSLFTYIKTLLGYPASPPSKSDSTEEEEDRKSITRFLPSFLQSPWVITVGTNVLLAMAMTKLFLPFKLGVVVAVTPTVAKRLRALGFDFGKMRYKDMAQDAKGRLKERAASKRGAAGGGEGGNA